MCQFLLFTAIPVVRAFGYHPELQYQSLFKLLALFNADIQRFGTRAENNRHHRLSLCFSKRTRHMVFEFKIVGKFRDEVLNFARDGGTKRRRRARTRVSVSLVW